MDKWIHEMGYTASEEFMEIFKQKCPAGMKFVWKHITQHVRPQSEVEIIRKQCLLHKLKNSHRYEKIEVPLNNINDYKNYVKMENKKMELKQIKDELKRKKASIKETLETLKSIHEKKIEDEHNMKEKFNRLRLLRNKKETILRLINDLNHDKKAMEILIEEPEKTIGFENATKWELDVSEMVKELNHGMEYQSVLKSLKELVNKPQIDFSAQWDSAEDLMTSTEETFLSLKDKLDTLKEKLGEKKVELTKVKNKIANVIENGMKGDNKASTYLELLETFEKDLLVNQAQKMSQELSKDQTLVLMIEKSNIDWIQKQIECEAKELCLLLPVENPTIQEEILLPERPEIILPLSLPVNRLINSLSHEISAFMNMPLFEKKKREQYVWLKMDSTSVSQYSKMKVDMEKLVEFMSFIDKIPRSIPTLGSSTVDSENKAFSTNVSEELMSNIQTTFMRVKGVLNFLMNEPLNLQLTGIEVDGQDSTYWLGIYNRLKEQINNEETMSKKTRR